MRGRINVKQLSFCNSLLEYYDSVIKDCPDDMLRNSFIKIDLISTNGALYIRKDKFKTVINRMIKLRKYAKDDKIMMNSVRDMIYKEKYPFHKWKTRKTTP